MRWAASSAAVTRSDQGAPEFVVCRLNHPPILDVSMSGGTVTDKQGRAAVASLVTGGSVLLGTALLAAGCASSGPPARSPSPHSTASHSPAATTAELTAMAARYMAVARPANRELDHEFDGFDDHLKD